MNCSSHAYASYIQVVFYYHLGPLGPWLQYSLIIIENSNTLNRRELALAGRGSRSGGSRKLALAGRGSRSCGSGSLVRRLNRRSCSCGSRFPARPVRGSRKKLLVRFAFPTPKPNGVSSCDVHMHVHTAVAIFGSTLIWIQVSGPMYTHGHVAYMELRTFNDTFIYANSRHERKHAHVTHTFASPNLALLRVGI